MKSRIFWIACFIETFIIRILTYPTISILNIYFNHFIYTCTINDA